MGPRRPRIRRCTLQLQARCQPGVNLRSRWRVRSPRASPRRCRCRPGRASDRATLRQRTQFLRNAAGAAPPDRAGPQRPARRRRSTRASTPHPSPDDGSSRPLHGRRQIDHLAQRTGIGEYDGRTRKTPRIGVGRSMIDDGHAPPHGAGRRRDGFGVRSRRRTPADAEPEADTL